MYYYVHICKYQVNLINGLNVELKTKISLLWTEFFFYQLVMFGTYISAYNYRALQMYSREKVGMANALFPLLLRILFLDQI